LKINNPIISTIAGKIIVIIKAKVMPSRKPARKPNSYKAAVIIIPVLRLPL
jgi:hypothetical protein